MDRLALKKENLSALPLVAPFVIIYLALFIYPSLQMIAMSFSDSALTRAGDWVGLDNYARLFGDSHFVNAVRNTLYFVLLTVVPGTLIGLGLALVVHRLKGVWQAIALAVFFIPYILPASTVTAVAWWLTSDAASPLGGFVRASNGTVIPVWRDASLFLPAVAMLTIWWQVGFSVLIFVAGLRTLPRELYEAAQLDGAGRWATFRRISWPLMWPVTALVLTIQLILQIKVFDQIYLMVGGQSSRTTVLVQYVYNLAFTHNQAGYASTVAVALFVIVATAVVFQFQLLRLRRAK